MCCTGHCILKHSCMFAIITEVFNAVYLSVCLSACLSVSLSGLAGLVVKASASGAEDPGFESRLRRGFSGSNHTSDFKIGTPAATLLSAWGYRISAGTGQPGVSIL